MKKIDATRKNTKTNKLSIRSETVRILTAQELSLVVAGNCAKGSQDTQSDLNFVGTC